MLTRSNRFHGHGSVRRVYRLGRPVRNSLASLHVLQDERIKRSRAAVVVSRKVDKSAVRRNRIRRRIYEIIRPRLPEFKRPTEVVITVYSNELATMAASDLEKLVNELFKKAKL